MKNHYKLPTLVIFIISFLWVSLPSLATPTQAKTVTIQAVTGLGTTSKAARLDAFRNAIAQVVGVYVRSDTNVENYIVKSDKIRTSSFGFIKRFKKLKETQAEGIFTGVYEVEVATELLEDDFKQVMGAEFRNVGHPTVAVIGWHMGNTLQSTQLNMAAVSAMNKALIQKGYKVVDAHQIHLLRQSEHNKTSTLSMDQKAQALANKIKADIYVTSFVDYKAPKVSVITKIYNSYTGQIFGEETGFAQSNIPLQTVEQAVAKTMQAVLKDIRLHWQDVLTQGSEYILILDNYKNSRERRLFKQILKETPGIIKVKQLSIAGKKAEFSVYSTTSPGNLFDQILEACEQKGFRFRNQEVIFRGGRALFIL